MTNNKLTDEKIKARINAIEDRRSASRDFWDGDYEYPEDIELLALLELQERRKSFRWIPIDEELPEDESTVIVKNIDGVQWVADFSDDCFYPDEFPVYKMGGDEITHWMRFPE